MLTIRIGLLLFAATVVFTVACRQSTPPAKSSVPLDAAAYQAEIQKWQSNRLASLTKDDGWLTLVGLFWLNKGENKFGSDPKSAVVLPKDERRASRGRFGWSKVGCV